MPTSWNDTLLIEQYLGKTINDGDTLVFEARLLLEPGLADNMQWQQKTYTLIKAYGRMQLKQEIEFVHQQLFTQKNIKALVKK